MHITTLLSGQSNTLERFTYHDFATYTRILSSNVVLKYSSKLTVILKRFYIICKISFYVSSTTSLQPRWRNCVVKETFVLRIIELETIPEVSAFVWKMAAELQCFYIERCRGNPFILSHNSYLMEIFIWRWFLIPVCLLSLSGWSRTPLISEQFMRHCLQNWLCT